MLIAIHYADTPERENVVAYIDGLGHHTAVGVIKDYAEKLESGEVTKIVVGEGSVADALGNLGSDFLDGPRS